MLIHRYSRSCSMTRTSSISSLLDDHHTALRECISNPGLLRGNCSVTASGFSQYHNGDQQNVSHSIYLHPHAPTTLHTSPSGCSSLADDIPSRKVASTVLTATASIRPFQLTSSSPPFLPPHYLTLQSERRVRASSTPSAFAPTLPSATKHHHVALLPCASAARNRTCRDGRRRRHNHRKLHTPATETRWSPMERSECEDKPGTRQWRGPLDRPPHGVRRDLRRARAGIFLPRPNAVVVLARRLGFDQETKVASHAQCDLSPHIQSPIYNTQKAPPTTVQHAKEMGGDSKQTSAKTATPTQAAIAGAIAGGTHASALVRHAAAAAVC